jgi:hypothetical protein
MASGRTLANMARPIKSLVTGVELDDQALEIVLGGIQLTLPRYMDTSSRQAIRLVLAAMMDKNPTYHAKIVKWFMRLVDRSTANAVCTLSAGQQLVLISWSQVLVRHTVRTHGLNACDELIRVHAVLLNGLMDKRVNARASRESSAVKETRRLFRDASVVNGVSCA